MAIIRSASIKEVPQTLPDQSVRRALKGWELRVAEAEERGRKAAETEGNMRCQQIQAQLQAAQAECDKRVAAVEQEYAQRWDHALAALSQAATDLDELQGRALAESEGDIIHLAVALAQQVLRHQVQVDEAWMVDLLHQVQDQVPGRQPPVVRMHPDDIAKLSERLNEATPAQRGLPTLEAEAGLPPGSCQVVSGGTVLDCGIASSWERLAAVMTAVVPHDGPSGGMPDKENTAQVDAPAADDDAGEVASS